MLSVMPHLAEPSSQSDIARGMAGVGRPGRGARARGRADRRGGGRGQGACARDEPQRPGGRVGAAGGGR
eukprot:1090584-Rhodomonas_salina.2